MTDLRDRVPAVPCRACGADVVFARHRQLGSMNPIDPVAASDGNLAVHLPGPTYVVLTTRELRAAEIPLFRSHFVSCPNADQFRAWVDNRPQVTERSA